MFLTFIFNIVVIADVPVVVVVEEHGVFVPGYAHFWLSIRVPQFTYFFGFFYVPHKFQLILYSKPPKIPKSMP